ncbi:paraquat-inducible protein A [Pseudooceanicola nanhaiensis]|uniref:paraquat-inducible protein A n=1 Tax=Pseudooceanicola nanhaiensis TaxID=375761 RepID=UPI001CD26A5E|nr:paraquat-inducible protein A [Pseudooceanicola nanhaiensis]MCA0921013.1 paraquat-inducible protein A [Pseudooceanicola nanhaiensis]
MTRLLTIANAALLLLYPIAWMAPLARAGVLPFFGLSEISVLSGLRALWPSDPLLALLVAVFALVAPMAKTLALLMIHLERAPVWLLGPVSVLGRLAMADVFLVALYITLAKGIGLGHVESAWGLWLFTFCTLASLGISSLTKKIINKK